MRVVGRCALIFALLAAGVSASGCGGSSRRLMSVSVTPGMNDAVNGDPVRFILDGTFSSDPVSEPVPASWSIRPDPRLLPGDVKIDSNGIAQCRVGLAIILTVQADPLQPVSGENPDNPTLATATLHCH